MFEFLLALVTGVGAILVALALFAFAVFLFELAREAIFRTRLWWRERRRRARLGLHR